MDALLLLNTSIDELRQKKVKFGFNLKTYSRNEQLMFGSF